MHRVLIVSVLCLALASPAMAQKSYNFTVDPAYEKGFPVAIGPQERVPAATLTFSPRVYRKAPEFYAPPGASEGPTILGLSANHRSKNQRTEVEVSFIRQFDKPEGKTIYEFPRSDLKERKGLVSVRRQHPATCKALFC